MTLALRRNTSLCRQEATMQISKWTQCQFKFQTLKFTHPFCSTCEFDCFINKLKTRGSAASCLYFLTAPVWMDAASPGRRRGKKVAALFKSPYLESW